ncbi:MAG TPA: ABC transporter ATP-binding protein [Gemmatimonadaceae bacterium]|nr:ABC transporter ATP-binding protein [Gemmatimonadaceae bacterium]
MAVRRQIGFLPEDFRFYDWLTASELLELHARLAGLDLVRARRRAPEALELVGLTPHAARRLHGFSKGMLQRVGLAQAVIHEPDLVFLDEPTSGLDPMGRRMVRDVIRGLRDRGVTVFLNSHLLSEIEVTCDRVAFIKDGEIVAHRDLHGCAEVREALLRVTGLPAQFTTRLRGVASGVRQDGDILRFEAPTDEVVATVVRLAVEAGGGIHHVSTAATSLEETFIHIVGEDRAL